MMFKKARLNQTFFGVCAITYNKYINILHCIGFFIVLQIKEMLFKYAQKTRDWE